MAHYVKCPKCGKKFNRDKVQAVLISNRRYGHASCYPDNTNFVPMANPEDKDLTALKDYAKNLLGNDYNPARVSAQIKKFHTQYDYSYSGMLKALHWFYDIKKNPIYKANGGLGIIPYIYQDAFNYFYNLYQAEQNLTNGLQYRKETKEIEIKSPRAKNKPHKLFSFLDDEKGEVDNGS